MSTYQHTTRASQPYSNEPNEQWHGAAVPLEELPAGLIEDEV